MKRTKLRLGALILLAIAALLLSTHISCELSNEDDDDRDDSGVTASQLAGIWLATFETPYEYDDGHEADAMIMEFDGNDYTMIFYFETEQDGGNRGSFAVSGSSLTLSVEEDWNDEDFWGAGPDDLSLPFSLSGAVLTVTGPGDVDIPLAKTSFSRPAALEGYWEYANGVTMSLTLESDGTYTFYRNDGESTYEDTGVDWLVSGTASGYMRTRTTARSDAVGPVSIDCLTPYGYSSMDDELTLTFGSEGEYTFTLGTPPV